MSIDLAFNDQKQKVRLRRKDNPRCHHPALALIFVEYSGEGKRKPEDLNPPALKGAHMAVCARPTLYG